MQDEGKGANIDAGKEVSPQDGGKGERMQDAGRGGPSRKRRRGLEQQSLFRRQDTRFKSVQAASERTEETVDAAIKLGESMSSMV